MVLGMFLALDLNYKPEKFHDAQKVQKCLISGRKQKDWVKVQQQQQQQRQQHQHQQQRQQQLKRNSHDF